MTIEAALLILTVHIAKTVDEDEAVANAWLVLLEYLQRRQSRAVR